MIGTLPTTVCALASSDTWSPLLSRMHTEVRHGGNKPSLVGLLIRIWSDQRSKDGFWSFLSFYSFLSAKQSRYRRTNVSWNQNFMFRETDNICTEALDNIMTSYVNDSMFEYNVCTKANKSANRCLRLRTKPTNDWIADHDICISFNNRLLSRQRLFLSISQADNGCQSLVRDCS